MGLKRIAMVDLPSGGDYDHADVHLPNGRVYLANTALDGEPDVVLVDARRACAYVCVGDPPTLHVVDLAERAMRKAISTGAGAKTAALDAERHLLYVFLPKAGQAWVYAL
ncbi:MAG: YncE family protein [Acidimicrobiales bacterium]